MGAGLLRGIVCLGFGIYTIVLLKSVIKECVEDLIKHAIKVGIINEGLFQDINVLDENIIGG